MEKDLENRKGDCIFVITKQGIKNLKHVSDIVPRGKLK